MKRYIQFIILLVLTLLCVGFIFANSAKTGEESGEASSAVVRCIETVLERIGTDPEVSERFIRKLAHFLEYALLSLLTCATVRSYFPRNDFSGRRYLLFATSPIFCFGIANVDEFCVQASTVGRGPSFRDVCIDTAGAIVAAGFFALILLFIAYRKEKKKDA